MANTETAHPPAHAKVEKKEETEKEKADRELKERLEKEGPSTLLVAAPESETDKLRKAGVAVTEVATASLPGGGPANIPGMSDGGPTPKKEDVQKDLDDAAKEKKDAEKKSEKKAA